MTKPSVWKRWTRRIVIGSLVVVLIGFVIPENRLIPVQGAGPADWHPQSFWYEPWGSSGTHKGVDIFAATGTPVIAAEAGHIIFRGQLAKGGNVIAVLGPKWRVYYYAHLDALADTNFWIGKGDVLGTVGTSGNAIGKAPHLHYSVVSLVPLPWKMTTQSQGWKRMFYLPPL